jgi:ligand-binding SRPBCC domain-containing protein
VKIYTLRKEQFITRPLKDVFEFFSRPENLERITPPKMGFNIITPRPIEMRPGALIDYTVRTLGIPVRWTTLITDYDPPHRFIDVQLRGPYSFWHHTHIFEAVDGGTRIVDEVRYVLPFGPIGRLAHTLIVKRELEKIFAYRAQVIESVFSAGQAARHPSGQS